MKKNEKIKTIGLIISIIIISALIFMFREIRGTKTQEADLSRIENVEKFNKSYESFTKDLYGTDYIDYYSSLKENIDKIVSIYKSTSNLEALGAAYEIINNHSSYIRDTENAKTQRDRILEKIGQDDTNIRLRIDDDIKDYNEYKELKNTKYKFIKAEYDEGNGRIYYIEFKKDNG